jgi:hypothetical protein
MILNAIYSKIISESLLSFYPVFVKKIGLSIPIQLWTRLLAYVIISAFFINRTFVFQSLTSYNAILLALINLSHVYFSYMGFKYLDSGVRELAHQIDQSVSLEFKKAFYSGKYIATKGKVFYV